MTMLSKLFDLFARRPDLILNHALAYVDLAQQEFAQTRHRLQRQVIAAVIAFSLAITFLVVAGVAALLVVAGVIALTPAVAAVPGIVLSGAALAGWYATQAGNSNKRTVLRSQIEDDIQLLRDIAENRP